MSDEIDETEKRISDLLASVGVKPDAAVKKFKTMTGDDAARAAALEKTFELVTGERRRFILDALNDQPWSLAEINKFFSSFGLEDGLNSATKEQIETVFLDMRKSGMIIQKDIEKRSAP